MPRYGRVPEKFSGNSDLPYSARDGLYEGCSEQGCTHPIIEHCGCLKGFCKKHLEEHRLKTHRTKSTK